MARPTKEGLEYFPLDCDIDQDDKIMLVEAQHGVVGFCVVIKVLMKIYKNGYFYEWTEREQLLFSRKVNVDINSINVIINDLIKWGFFNEYMYKTYKILTSKGIQVRYLSAVGRRQKVKMLKKYLLLDYESINVYKNLIIVDINSINSYIGTQSKVKESKVKESKVKESKVKESKVKESNNKSEGEQEGKEPPTLSPLSFPSKFHKLFFENISEVSYRMWIEDCYIEENEDLIRIETAESKKTVIENRYADTLSILTGKKVLVKVGS